MEGHLPPASPNLCSFLWTKLREAGDNPSEQYIVFLARLISEYFRNTPEGKQTAFTLLDAEIFEVGVTNAYRFANAPPHIPDIPNNLLKQFRGYLYEGERTYAPSQIAVEQDGNMDGCEDTGILAPKGYCLQNVLVYGQGGKQHLRTLSNYARLMHPDPKVSDTASRKTCELCPVKTCEYHPSRDQQMSLLSNGY
jgi:hypothetical protein